MSTHDGKTVRCTATLADDEGEPLTEEMQLDAAHPDAPGTTEVPQDCGERLTFEEHGRFERTLRGERRERFESSARRERFESSALVFECPTCGGETAVCPVCSDPDDDSPGGWIDASDGGDPIPCHNCNQQEIAERRRRGTA